MFLLSSDYWEVKKTKSKGKGVFVKKDIESGVIIGDYLGTIIRTEEEEKYEKKHGFYTMYYHERASIFPDTTKDGIHRLNHSCMPNCYMYSYQGHTLYFALRHIFPGEELTVSYLLNPLEEACDTCTHFCKCESELCTNTWHLTKKQHDTWTDFDNKMTENVKLPRVTYGKQLEKLPDYPKKIADSDVYPLFGSQQKPAVNLHDEKIPSRKILRQKIRETGQALHFKKLGITILGIADNQLICA